MIADLVIRGGTLVTGEGQRRGALAIRDGRIAAVDRDAAMPQARETIDASGWHVLPGVIDTHVHLRDPGRTEREDWLTGTRAAAAGGITTILEMPISVPAVTSADILRARAAHVQPRSLVDFGLYGAATAENLDQIEPLAAAGAIGFKTFRVRTIPGRVDFEGVCCPDAGQMLEVLERTAATGLTHAVHAEDQQVLDLTIARAQRAGRRDPLVHPLARPEVSEAACVAQCIALAQATGARLQIAHTSSAAAVAMVAQAKAAGLSVTAETCPHYLMFTQEALGRWGAYAKCNPPLRSQETQERLWEGVRSGVIDVIGTDHVPFLAALDRTPFLEDFWGAPPGIPALEEFLPLLLTAVRQGRISLPQLVRATSENAARLFGLWPRKGNLAVGADADLTIVDLAAEQVHDHRSLHTKARDTALMYDGFCFQGLPVMTVVRGRIAMRKGEVVGEPGWGQWVKPGR